jgi:hypothetical protein
MKALSSLIAISALALVPTLAHASSGLDVDVYTSYSIAGGGFDGEGTKQDLPEGYTGSFMLIDLGVGYAINDDLSLSVSLPIVQKAAKYEMGGQTLVDDSSMGLGDASIAARYMSKLNDTASVGGELRFKMATGNDGSADGEAATGSGYHNIQAAIVADLTPVDNLSVGIDAGYIMSMGKTENDVTVNPGDVIFANAYFGYDIDGIVPRLGVHFMDMGLATATVGDATADVEDTNANALGVSADVAYAINDTMGVTVGLGTSLAHSGLNLPWGMALSGKNVTTGMAFNLGFNAEF